MQFTSYLNSPGEHALIFQGLAGQLEAVLTIPPQTTGQYVAFLGHPHSLQGGSMNNKVVTTMARAFKELNIPSLRFNFRGVGQSEGLYDAGVGESDDLLALIQAWQHEQADAKIILAGFSFGSYVTYRAAVHSVPALLISVAPPVHHYKYLEEHSFPWLIIQGDEDEVVPVTEVIQFASDANPPIPVIHFPETSHFFHGKLIELKQQIMDYMQSQVLNS